MDRIDRYIHTHILCIDTYEQVYVYIYVCVCVFADKPMYLHTYIIYIYIERERYETYRCGHPLK